MFAIFDQFYFRMFPAQENIFVEDAHSKRKEKQVFDNINAKLKMKESVLSRKKVSVYDIHTSS